MRDLVAGQPVATTYLGSRRNLGGAGGFALACCTRCPSAPTGCGWPTTTAAPRPEVLATLLDAREHRPGRGIAGGVDLDYPRSFRLPATPGPGLAPAVLRVRHQGSGGLLPGIASLFNGALFRASTLDLGVPDLRLFMRGDEVELHRRLVRSGLPFGTCLPTTYLLPQGAAEFKPILGGRMHTQYPDDAIKRFFTYRNRGYLLSQPGLRKLLPQEWLRFGRFFLVSAGIRPGLAEWIRLRRLGRRFKVRRTQ